MTTTSKASTGIAGLYSTGTGSLTRSDRLASGLSSASAGSSASPLSIEYTRWIVVMHTRATGSSLLEERRWTL